MLYNIFTIRRGISLEVIVEEDDNSEVGYRISRDYSQTSSDTNEEIEKTFNNKSKEEHKGKMLDLHEERRLSKQRSLSCEILTIQDVEDNEIWEEENEIWEEEAQEWDADEKTAEEFVISRRKILEEIYGKTSENYKNQQKILKIDDKTIGENNKNFRLIGEESSVDDEEMESILEQPERKIEVSRENFTASERQIYDNLEDTNEESRRNLEESVRKNYEESEEKIEESHISSLEEENEDYEEIIINKNSFVFQQKNDETNFEDSWITVGDLIPEADVNVEDQKREQFPNKTQKEVKFSDQIQILENYDDTGSEEESEKDELENLDIDQMENRKAIKTKNIELDVLLKKIKIDVVVDHVESVNNTKNIFNKSAKKQKEKTIFAKLVDIMKPPAILVEERMLSSAKPNKETVNEILAIHILRNVLIL